MEAKIIGKKIIQSVDKNTGVLKESAFLYFTSKFGNVMGNGMAAEGLETGDAYVSADLARQIPLNAHVSLDFDKRGYLKNIDVIEGGNGK